jgi:hypothetical protein
VNRAGKQVCPNFYVNAIAPLVKDLENPRYLAKVATARLLWLSLGNGVATATSLTFIDSSGGFVTVCLCRQLAQAQNQVCVFRTLTRAATIFRLQTQARRAISLLRIFLEVAERKS